MDLELRTRIVDVDPLDQRVTMDMRAFLWDGDEVIAEEESSIVMTLYFTHEIELMLAAAGFVDVELKAGYEDRPPTGDDDFVVFIARKPVDDR